ASAVVPPIVVASVVAPITAMVIAVITVIPIVTPSPAIAIVVVVGYRRARQQQREGRSSQYGLDHGGSFSGCGASVCRPT
ncbi:MAG: hypothetical protein M3O07_13710, partial [Pseudomonadota bacterium]|nr:hypothetical protein [Pseudomonadota bacterium]